MRLCVNSSFFPSHQLVDCILIVSEVGKRRREKSWLTLCKHPTHASHPAHLWLHQKSYWVRISTAGCARVEGVGRQRKKKHRCSLTIWQGCALAVYGRWPGSEKSGFVSVVVELGGFPTLCQRYPDWIRVWGCKWVPASELSSDKKETGLGSNNLCDKQQLWNLWICLDLKLIGNLTFYSCLISIVVYFQALDFRLQFLASPGSGYSLQVQTLTTPSSLHLGSVAHSPDMVIPRMRNRSPNLSQKKGRQIIMPIY